MAELGINGLERFMEAVRNVESSGDYQRLGPVDEDLGTARGAYQIMSANWATWAAQAGVAGADWRDPAAQDHVARFKMTEYYREFGSWDLVAIAWFGGPGRARTAQKQGMAALTGVRDSLGTAVPDYVSKVREEMGLTSESPIARKPQSAVGDSSRGDIIKTLQGLFPSGRVVGAAGDEITDPNRLQMIGFLDQMSSAIAGGQRERPGSPRLGVPESGVEPLSAELTAGLSPEQVGVAAGKALSGAIQLAQITGSNGQVGQLTPEAAQAFEALRAAAERDGLDVNFSDTYRSPELQARARAHFEATGTNLAGQKVPNIATPEGSRHTKGTAVDFTINDQLFGWLQENAAQFGFRLTRPDEPWEWIFEGGGFTAPAEAEPDAPVLADAVPGPGTIRKAVIE